MSKPAASPLPVLLQACRPQPALALPATLAAYLARQQGEAGWGALQNLALRHGVLPLLYHGLKQADVAMPEQFQASNQRVTLRNLRLGAELHSVVAHLQAAGLPCLTLKGPAQSQLAYGNITLRSGTDLDIATPPEARSDVMQALAELGYAQDDPGQSIAAMEHLGQINLRHRASGLLLDLHWRLNPLEGFFPLSVASAIAASRTVQIAGLAVPVLGDQHRLLYLAVHGALHRWERLIWLCDLAWELHPDMPAQNDMAAIRRMASETGAARLLQISLHLAGSELGAAVDAEARRPLPPGLALATAWMRHKLHVAPMAGEVPNIVRIVTLLLFQDGWQRRWGELRRMAGRAKARLAG